MRNQNTGEDDDVVPLLDSGRSLTGMETRKVREPAGARVRRIQVRFPGWKQYGSIDAKVNTVAERRRKDVDCAPSKTSPPILPILVYHSNPSTSFPK